MSFTFLAKSSAYSWKMSFCGHVDCQRIVMGPWARTTEGKPRATAPTAAPVRKVRRDVSGGACGSGMEDLRRRWLGVHPLGRGWAAGVFNSPSPPGGAGLVADLPG